MIEITTLEAKGIINHRPDVRSGMDKRRPTQLSEKRLESCLFCGTNFFSYKKPLFTF